MIPDKIHWLLAYQYLAMILEQEGKHWLMKVEQKKQIQDKATGQLFQGEIENLGTHIVMESQKMAESNTNLSTIQFTEESANQVFTIDYSAFLYCEEINGFSAARISSINYQYLYNGEEVHNGYKIRFKNCSIVTIPLASSATSADVYATKWIKTNSVEIVLPDITNQFNITQQLQFADGITNVSFYYPLTESIQPLNLLEEGNDNYITEAIVKDAFIGYPAFWFICDQTKIGPYVTYTDELSYPLIHIANEGNSSKYTSKIYVNVDMADATPDGTSTDNFVIYVTPKNEKFTNTSNDFMTNLDTTIHFQKTSTNETYDVTINDENDYIQNINMISDIGWEYVNDEKYQIQMNVFDNNASSYALKSLLMIQFNESIPFSNINESDLSYVGIRMSSSNTSSEHVSYPYDLNKWSGLPTYLNELTDDSTQYGALYAIHNTPLYNPENPESRQTAALLLDPGKEETDKGRVYILSNDETTYQNNATTEHPKPERTAARICDIPTSVAQLSNIKNLSPTAVVDPEYVRTELSFSEEDKNQIYNILPTRWVRPTAVDEGSEMIYLNYPAQNNDKFVFQSLELLNKVDLINHNNFRKYVNLNPQVPVENISVATIYDAGHGYVENDTGLLIIGGVPFEYHVQSVDDNGCVTSVTLSQGSEDITQIPLTNFDLPSDTHGITSPYGTSPVNSSGTGLRIRLLIDEYDTISMKKDEIFEDLFAFVKDADGISLYEYDINQNSTTFPKSGTWNQKTIVSPFENSTYHSEKGYLSPTDTLMSYIIPRLQSLPVATADPNLESTALKVYHSPTFVNVIDETKTPVKIPSTKTDDDTLDANYVDFTRFYCDGMKVGKATETSTQGVISYLKENNENYFDTFVIWKWVSRSEHTFSYGHIRRGFNNLISTDTTALLPKNELITDKYVHSNYNTTIVWDVSEVGVMLWTYNPKYTKREVYTVDAETRELHVERKDLSWDDIEIFDMSSGKTFHITKNGKFEYNVLSNNPNHFDADTSEVFYQQPDLYAFASVNTSVSDKLGPMGNWQLVFPRVNEFIISNVTDGRTFTPLKLQLIRGDNITNADEVLDENHHVVNHKTIITSDTENGIIIKMYNSEKGQWEQI